MRPELRQGDEGRPAGLWMRGGQGQKHLVTLSENKDRLDMCTPSARCLES
jgi:hypothetical protein